MKTRPLLSALTTVLLLAPTLAYAHPGHDGDHDFVWDFDHLAGHPLATIACFLLLGSAAALAWRGLKLRSTSGTKPVKRE